MKLFAILVSFAFGLPKFMINEKMGQNWHLGRSSSGGRVGMTAASLRRYMKEQNRRRIMEKQRTREHIEEILKNYFEIRDSFAT